MNACLFYVMYVCTLDHLLSVLCFTSGGLLSDSINIDLYCVAYAICRVIVTSEVVMK